MLPVGRGTRKHKKDDASERTCIVTRDSQPKGGLIRFALDPDGVVTPDLAERLPGRGLWVSADRKVLKQAISKNAFSRAAKTKATIPDGLLEMVDAGLARRIGDLISLCRRSNDAMTGFETVKTALVNGDAKILIQASDGSEGQRRKLNTPRFGKFIGCLTSAELGLAFGRDYAIHAALTGKGLSDRVLHDANRLAGVRGLDTKTKTTKADKRSTER